MDVTKQILAHNNIYGASDYTGPQTLSASRSLNYAEGSSITKPTVENLNVIPFTFNYQDAVGLFGVENHFIRVDVDIDRDYSKGCYEEDWYECAEITPDDSIDAYYTTAVIDRSVDLVPVNTFDPPIIIPFTRIPLLYDAYISVDLRNLKVNNQYIDNWLDVRLYTKDRKEFIGDYMYVHLKDYFYIGIHARNTRRLPYNIQVIVGEELRSELPTNECKDEWEIVVDACACIEEEYWVCAEMALYNESGDYVSADVFPKDDPTTVNTYQAARVTLQGTECIIDTLADFLGFPPKGRVGQVPPPKTHLQTMRKDHRSDPCCTTCH